MIKLTYFIWILSFFSVSSIVKTCNSGKAPYSCCGNIADSIILSTQDDVNQFKNSLPDGCNCFKGKVEIRERSILDLSPLDFLRGVGSLEVILLTNLKVFKGFNNLDTVYKALLFSQSTMEEIDAFHSLRYVGTEIFVNTLTKLQKLSGFSRLGKCGKLVITSNPLLKEIPSFPNLKTVSSLMSIQNNDNLEKIDGFPSLDTISSGLAIQKNEKVANILGFNKLVFQGFLSIHNNKGLVNINGFSSLKNGHTISISDNPSLRSIHAFKAIKSIHYQHLHIENNAVLDTITGFTKLKELRSSLMVFNNPNLKTCCFLYRVLNNPVGNLNYEIKGNSKGCLSKEDIIEAGECK